MWFKELLTILDLARVLSTTRASRQATTRLPSSLSSTQTATLATFWTPPRRGSSRWPPTNWRTFTWAIITVITRPSALSTWLYWLRMVRKKTKIWRSRDQPAILIYSLWLIWTRKNQLKWTFPASPSSTTLSSRWRVVKISVSTSSSLSPLKTTYNSISTTKAEKWRH